MQDEVTMATKLLRYPDLVKRGLFNNRATLYRWIKEKRFPPGRKWGPNTRAWTEDEVEAVVAAAAEREAVA